MLRGWTLTDASLRELTESRRHAALDEAIDDLNRSLVLHPGSVALRIASMRAHAFRGDREQMLEAGRTALSLNDGSPDVKASVGLIYSLWGVAEGGPLLEQALRENADGPPWYHVGLAVIAMMQEDPRAMSGHLQALDEMGRDQPLLVLLTAAHAARSGQIAKARQALDRLQSSPVARAMKIGMLIDRAPIAPAVRQRLNAWLRPALAS
jgi:hypothetical protein